MPIYASEDFGWYVKEVPGAFMFLGTGKKCGLHESKFDFEDDLIK